jgi:translocation and assembly module TamB
VRRNVSLNLALDLGERFRLKGRGLDTRLAGDLRLTTPGGRMTLVGDIRTVDGTYAAYGQKLTIDRGVISFVGTPDNPRLDIEATRPNTDIRVGVAVGGTAQSPRVRLFSEPEMSDTDKLSWLVLGRAPGQLGRTESALLQRAVLALLAGEGDSPTAELSSTLGLDQLSIRQDDAGGVSETIVSLGRQISQRWYVGYERSLNATAGSWQLIYRVAQRFTVRAQAGADNSVDLIWTWRW